MSLSSKKVTIKAATMAAISVISLSAIPAASLLGSSITASANSVKASKKVVVRSKKSVTNKVVIPSVRTTSTVTTQTTAQQLWSQLSDGQSLTDNLINYSTNNSATQANKTFTQALASLPDSAKGSSVLYSQDNSKLGLTSLTYIIAQDGTIPTTEADVNDTTEYSVGLGLAKYLGTDAKYSSYTDSNLLAENVHLTGAQLKALVSAMGTTGQNLFTSVLDNQLQANANGDNDVNSIITDAQGLYDATDTSAIANHVRLSAFIMSSGSVSNPKTILAMYITYNVLE